MAKKNAEDTWSQCERAIDEVRDEVVIVIVLSLNRVQTG
jgi:phosphosulfolactate phosphohydrolase-like enzyme